MVMNTKLVTQKWWRIYSPCFLISIVLFIAVIYCLITLRKSDGWSLYGVFIYGVFILVLQTLDGILKVWIKPSTLVLWIVEIVLIVGIPPLFQYVTN